MSKKDEKIGKIGKKLTDYVKKSQNLEEIHWQPVSNIPIDEIYKNLPKAKEFHEEYAKLWLKGKGR